MVKGPCGISRNRSAHVLNALLLAVISIGICVLSHTASAHVLPSLASRPPQHDPSNVAHLDHQAIASKDAGRLQDTILGLRSAISSAPLALEERAAVTRELQLLLDRFVEQDALSQSPKQSIDSAVLASSSFTDPHTSSRRSLRHVLRKRAEGDQPPGLRAGFGVLIAVLVILSGMFAGLTLGYFSLDETALAVLAQTGTPKQRRAAEKILPVRKDGHLLLTTLLVANMIFNECETKCFDMCREYPAHARSSFSML